MSIEMIPLVFGVLVALGGIGLVADARLPDSAPRIERRRRRRTERDRRGEELIGCGLVAVGASLLGRDAWRWGTVAMLLGVALIAAGAWRNRRYLYEALAFRGAARRGRSAEREPDAAALARADAGRDPLAAPPADAPPPDAAPRLRIR